tara:strand:+ start:732 stop:1331 length:600 start_codon:yes stop_codon:yes gene_type:complete
MTNRIWWLCWIIGLYILAFASLNAACRADEVYAYVHPQPIGFLWDKVYTIHNNQGSEHAAIKSRDGKKYVSIPIPQKHRSQKRLHVWLKPWSEWGSDFIPTFVRTDEYEKIESLKRGEYRVRRIRNNGDVYYSHEQVINPPPDAFFSKWGACRDGLNWGYKDLHKRTTCAICDKKHRTTGDGIKCFNDWVEPKLKIRLE